MRTRRLAIAFLLVAPTGCASVTGARGGLPDRWRTIASANGETQPAVTGPPGAEMAAELGTPEPRARSTGRISGRVIDEDGQPVANAEVRLADGSSRAGRDVRTVSDAAGGFTLKGLRAGDVYTLVAEADDGRDVMVGRTRAEAPETGVKIRLLDPETAEAATPDRAPRSRVDRASNRSDVAEEPEELREEPLPPPRARPRSRVNEADLPPAEEAESLDLTSRDDPRGRTTRVNWRPATAPSDEPAVEPEVPPAAAPIEPLPASPARPREREPEPEPRPIEPPAVEPSAAAPAEDDGPNPLPPAKEPPPAARPIEPAPPAEAERDLLPPSQDAPSSSPGEIQPAVPVPSPSPAPSTEPAPSDPIAEPLAEPKPAETAPLDPVPAPDAPSSSASPEPAPESAPPPADKPVASAAIPAETEPRKRPTWRELTEREAATAVATASLAPSGSIPLSTRRLPERPSDPESGSRLRGLFGGKGREPEAASQVLASSCRYDSKKQRLIDFRLPDLDGNPVQLRDVEADFILLDFWGTWCKPCKESIPHLVDLQSRYGSKLLRVVGVASEEHGLSPAEQAQGVDAMAREMKINYPLLLSGADGKPCPLQEALHIGAFPTMILLDRTGQVLWRGTGAEPITMARLERVLAARADTGVVRR